MLSIVGTPIGNLEDLSFRQARTISQASFILTEDTRSYSPIKKTIENLFKLPINSRQKLVSYHKMNEFEKLPYALDLINNEENIALISENGMPLISDPGYLLVKTLIQKNIPFTVIPGPTAATTALVYSGFNPGSFMFLGFLPKKSGQLKSVFEKINQINLIIPETVFIAYESPNRVNQTLALLEAVFPLSNIVIMRELTKKFEEIIRDPFKIVKRSYKGEITLAIQFPKAKV